MAIRVGLATTLLVYSTQAALYYPNPQIALLEHILVDNWGAYASNFSSAMTPCTRYVTQTGDAAINSGRTTAAQWMRVLFHDMVTANVSAGTGGVDASIGFETARSENSGSAFNDSFTFWRPFVNEAVSMADLVAMGSVMSSGLCGGGRVPYRPGRIDAVPNPNTGTGVPAPETDLDTTLTFFERSGFDRADAIAFTACGHTMGSVHHGGFPDVVDASAVSPSNTNGGANFDTTRGVFDNNIVQEYVNWTGQRGGPLVTTSNVSTQSDLRLYESDGNTTMRSLYSQGNDGFLSTCVSLFERAINTVPSGVQLGDVITPLPIKPINVTFDLEPTSNGAGAGTNTSLILSGKIRILVQMPVTQIPLSTLTLRTSTGSTHTLARENDLGNSVFGTTIYFPFQLNGTEALTSSITISAPSITAQTFQLPTQVVVMPSLTSLTGSTLNASIAITQGKCGDYKVQVAAPITQPMTLAPKIVTTAMALQDTTAALGLGGWSGLQGGLCGGVVSFANVPTGLVSVKAVKGGQVLDTLMIGGGNVGW